MKFQTEIRRLYITDKEWERTSESWKALKPNKNFNRISDSDESLCDYHLRLNSRFNIPIEVLEQWLYNLYYDKRSVNNYGWMDFDRIEFVKTEMSFKKLSQVRVVENFKNYVEERSKYKTYDELPCIERDKRYWIDNDFWRTPPIILNVSTLPKNEIHHYSDIGAEYQLVEGHSRLGHLYSLHNCGLLKKKKHFVYLMKYIEV